jgi:hypothetical protein
MRYSKRRRKMRVYISLIAAMLLATGTAHAKNVRKSILPPPKYDHLYEGRITIIHESSASLPCRPMSLTERLGCAYLEENKERKDKECVIWLASREEIEEAGYTENTILRREIASCNGWEGYRRLPYEVKLTEK